MSVRVKLVIMPKKGNWSPVEASAVVNSGYEADVSEVIVPVAVSRRLGLWPHPPSDSVVETFFSAGGEFRGCRARKAATVKVQAPGRASKKVAADIVISQMETEVLISDALASELKIGILDPKKGLWFFIDAPETHYESEPRQIW